MLSKSSSMSIDVKDYFYVDAYKKSASLNVKFVEKRWFL